MSEDLQPGTSAILFIVGDGNAEFAITALKAQKGTVRHTSFPPQVEGELRRILKKRTVYAGYPSKPQTRGGSLLPK